MMALIDDNHAVSCEHDTGLLHPRQGRKHGYIQSMSDSRSLTAPNSYVLSLQAEKADGCITPLIYEHGSMHQNQCRGSGPGDHRASHHGFPRARWRA